MKTNKKIRQIPKFKSEEQERKFWSTHDSTDYVDWSKAKNYSFPDLKFSTETISLRLPKSLLDDIKMIANKNDVPYQSLMKIMLAEKVAEKQSRKYGT